MLLIIVVGLAQVVAGLASKWLGWLDSNQRMLGSKPSALPLGDTPINLMSVFHSLSGR